MILAPTCRNCGAFSVSVFATESMPLEILPMPSSLLPVKISVSPLMASVTPGRKSLIMLRLSPPRDVCISCSVS